jgi:hypothetical protein
MIFLISSQMELLFASSFLKLVRMGSKETSPQKSCRIGTATELAGAAGRWHLVNPNR